MIKFTKKKVILPCCVQNWAKHNQAKISVLAKAARIQPWNMIQRIEDGFCFQDTESYKIQDATMGAIQAIEIPDGISYEDINRRNKDRNTKHLIKAEFCQCKRYL